VASRTVVILYINMPHLSTLKESATQINWFALLIQQQWYNGACCCCIL